MKKMILPLIAGIVSSICIIIGANDIHTEVTYPTITEIPHAKEVIITENVEEKTEETIETTVEEIKPQVEEVEEIEEPEVEETEVEEPEVEEISQEIYLSDGEMKLIAIITMAEAEGQSEYGQRLVIDTILNRVDSPRFPNTVQDVIYSPGQFSCVWNGRADRCYVKDEIYQLVLEECITRSNRDVVFFTAGGYAYNGVPLFQEGDHYFEAIKN